MKWQPLSFSRERQLFTYQNQATKSFVFRAGRVKILRSPSRRLLHINQIIFSFRPHPTPLGEKMDKEERASKLTLYVLRLNTRLFNWEGGKKPKRAGVVWCLSRKKFLQDCSIGSSYILITLYLGFLICVKGIKIPPHL